MRTKIFQAETVQEAFRLIKAELGPDAVILCTNQVRVERTLLNPFGRPAVEVEAAIDRDPVTDARESGGLEEAVALSPSNESELSPPDFRRTLAASMRIESERPHGAKPLANEAAAEEWDLDEDALVESSGVEDAEGGAGGDRETFGNESFGSNTYGSTLAKGREFGSTGPGLLPGGGRSLEEGLAPAQLRRHLIDRGCAPSTASQLVAEAVTDAAQRGGLSEDALTLALHRVVRRHIAVAATPDTGDCPKPVMVVGPTGAGKTLALSKLLSVAARKGAFHLTVIKLERERSPGIDPLQVLAAELGAQVDLVRNRRELVAAMEASVSSCPDRALLVDTPGRSLLDREAMNELRELFLAELPLEVHLVLPAQTSPQDFVEMATRYAGVPIHRLLVTKLDETTRYGRMLDVAMGCGLPLSYLGTGQDPRSGLEVATPDCVAELICGWRGGSVGSTGPEWDHETKQTRVVRPRSRAHHGGERAWIRP